MNLNYHEDWAVLKQELKVEYRRISKLIHPDRCPLDFKDNANVAFQVIQNDNQKINDYIKFKETNSGENPFEVSERKQQTKQPKQRQNKATGTNTGTNHQSQF